MLELNNIQICILDCLRYSLRKECNITNDGNDWMAIIKESYAQSVQLLAINALDELVGEGLVTVDSDSLTYIEQLRMKSLMANMKTGYAITEMNGVMRNNNYPYMILKGYAAASYYPVPGNRMLGDVDFLIDRNQQRSVEKALEENGYERWNTAEHICHVVFRKPDQDLEMHFEISGIPHGPQGEAVRRYMDGAVLDTIMVKLNGTDISIPRPKYHGLILLLHMQHHMLGEGLGLRHLMDLAVFTDKTFKESFWEEDLIPLLKEIGLFIYAKTMIKTASIYLGTVCPEWAEDANDELCDLVMKDILTGGNFGRKDNVRSKAGMMISNHGKDGTKYGKIHNLYGTLHESSANYWPWMRRHHIIWFVADCFRAIKYLYRWATGKRASLIEAGAFANERKSVYDRLKLFDIND